MKRLTSRGYVLNKDEFKSEIKQIKNDLSIIPKENHCLKNFKTNEKLVIAYLENEKKIYIPRFYGANKYGNPEKYELSKGDDINITFRQELRDYQKKIVSIYLNHVDNDGGGGGILEVPCGRGKTIMALNICSVLQKKSLIIVHKEFLLNQWIERIKDFLPDARVGKIQGKVFDIEEKDIVIGMIQTMYDRQYHANTFSSFGLTIVDEVHRIGSEEFSKTLLKVVTPFMLGISATVERKDGLTELIYMFIGPKIYSESREDTNIVEVRAIEYDNSDSAYKKEEFDFRGNIKYSTMINRISDFTPRKQFLVKILQNLILEDCEKQIMVLSHKRDLLSFLENEIVSHNIASCGQYVGGMKQHALLETESKQIVLATYAMAAEALDIKSLNTLVMVSPKTDIIQSVGRILRTNTDGKIIVDIIDSHDVFKNQWKKRRAFYKKSNYHIKMKTNDSYDKDEEWKIIHDPGKSRKIESNEKKCCQLDI